MKPVVMVVVVLLSACADDALEAGDCPSTPTGLAIDAVAPFYSGLVTLTFESSTPPGSVELQQYSASRGFWMQTYASLGQKDDGAYLLQVRPQSYGADNDTELKLRIRSTLQGCPPSGWAESDSVTLGDPIEGTTWIGEFGRTDLSSQLSASASGGGTANQQYSVAPTPPLKHTLTFGPGGVYSEQVDFTIQSPASGGVYNGCRFVLAYEGTWFGDYDNDTRIAVFDRRFKSLTGSTCANPAITELQPSSMDRLDDFTLSASNIDYSRLLETTPGTARWTNYNTLQNSFSSMLSILEDQTGPDTSSISGYLNLFDPTYQKQ
jgi:hypothetical protein